MLMRENDELRIQKCVDDELSSQETSELLRRLDGITNGWRTLACGLLEDRRIRGILAPRTDLTTTLMPAEHKPSGLSSAVPTRKEQATLKDQATRPDAAPSPLVAKGKNEPRVNKLDDVVRNWWSHPVTSLTLCAAIAFVGGLLIPDLNTSKSGGNSSLSKTDAPARSPLYPPSANGAQQYRVELQPGGRSVEIPVVTDLSKLHELDRRHPIFVGSNGSSENVQWMVLPVEGNKSMLIPVSEDSSSDMQ
jgi:hypothetical protein